LPNIYDFKHKDAHAKVEYVKRLHEQVKAQIACGSKAFQVYFDDAKDSSQ